MVPDRCAFRGRNSRCARRIRSLDLYSGHADGTELRDWIKERLPIRHQLFLVHGEETAMQGLAARLDGIVDAQNILRPELDEGFVLTGTGAQHLATAEPPRLPTAQVARMDWHNDASRLILDINEALLSSADEKARRVLIRRLQKALRNEDEVAPRPQ
jgi:metallo-beta-lactamase family protein